MSFTLRRTASRLIVAMALMSLAIAGLAAGPSAELSPEAVVTAQLDALRDGDHGAAYRYASPANQAMIGSAEAFAAMLQRQYGDMLSQSAARVTLKASNDEQAQVLAELTQPDGSQSAYVFVLSRQPSGPCAGCWMTDSVFALQPTHKQPMYSI